MIHARPIAWRRKGNRVDDRLSFSWAQTRDFDAVVSLSRQLAAHIEEDAPPLTLELFEAHYVGERAPMRLLIASRQGRVVGMISWVLTHELYSAKTRLYISDLSVDREARGLGVGSALMAQAKNWASAHRVAKLAWEVWRGNSSAKAFYERQGASIDDGAVPYVMALGVAS
jgi:GNAT superfamily N-acetyltransferase